MGIIGATNIIEESSGVFFISELIGLRPVRIFKTKFLGYFYVILLLFIYYALYLFTIRDNHQLYGAISNFSKTGELKLVQILVNLIYLPTMIISSVLNNSKMQQFYTEVESADEKFKLLNIRIDYVKSATEDFAKVCEIILATILFNLIEYYLEKAPDTQPFFNLVWIVNTFPQFVNSIAVGSFAIVIGKIRRRFQDINRFISDMTIFEKNDLSTLETDMNNVFRLRLLNKIHEKLINAANTIGEAYGFVILTSFIVYFLTTTAHLRIIIIYFGQVTNAVELLGGILWVIFYFGKYVYVIEACHQMTVQGKLSGSLLYNKWTDVDHHPFKQEADVVTRQIERRNLQLTACNFFAIDYPALTKIIVAMAAYLILVSQFSDTCEEK